MTKSDDVGLGGIVIVGLAVVVLAAWITHVIVAIGVLVSGSSLSIGYGILLAIGVFMPPVGIIHGLGFWFGFW